ncbi:MAG: hypothetical protein K6E31_09170, partial [bacterium]|nr:hypothetical protein [bacterium]
HIIAIGLDCLYWSVSLMSGSGNFQLQTINLLHYVPLHGEINKVVYYNIVFPFKEHERGPEIDGRPMPAVPLFRNAQILADGCALLLQIQISNKIGIVLPPCVIFVMTLCWRFFISCAICRREWKPERKP